jgi:hypothetical protein
MLASASAAARAAATLPLFLPQAPPDKVSGLIHAATLLAQLLGQGRALDSRTLHSAMEAAFGGTDAEGVWVWKDAYEALEAAHVMFLRKFGAAMRTRAGSIAAVLEMLPRLTGRLASHMQGRDWETGERETVWRIRRAPVRIFDGARPRPEIVPDRREVDRSRLAV